ncbi:hypothetical protein CONLIGDRAFT_701305 [Coniochaeta ligniaria NRRL 30616]|uniref:Uncharacterized protein n=1 Tax=Coniochaeta ligniaria NRRL 30616 TaxID=1408157 RepID=A0A1J7IM49_9PEZI|nr:hypothetical protein CONLIGDRAFT_701305 [Coniochaeta ligniaria NRRL 30616]
MSLRSSRAVAMSPSRPIASRREADISRYASPSSPESSLVRFRERSAVRGWRVLGPLWSTVARIRPSAVAKAVPDNTEPKSLIWMTIYVAKEKTWNLDKKISGRGRCQSAEGLLDGVPTAVKDEDDIDGYETCLGSVNDYTGKIRAQTMQFFSPHGVVLRPCLQEDTYPPLYNVSVALKAFQSGAYLVLLMPSGVVPEVNVVPPPLTFREFCTAAESVRPTFTPCRKCQTYPEMHCPALPFSKDQPNFTASVHLSFDHPSPLVIPVAVAPYPANAGVSVPVLKGQMQSTHAKRTSRQGCSTSRSMKPAVIPQQITSRGVKG